MDQALMIMNIVLIVLFVGLIVGFAIAIIAGIFRGFWKSTYYLVWFGTLITVALLTMEPLVTAIGGVDLTQLNLFVNLTGSDGNIVSIPVTTIQQTMHDSILTAMKINGIAGSYNELSNAAWSLSVMILKYALLLIDMLLIIILGGLFGWLLWALCFKHFVPKINKKKFKLRWISALEDGVSYLVMTSLFLAPLTSLVNVANQAWQSVEEHDTSNETVKMVDSFLDVYNNSLFAKTFFNWTVDEDSGLTIDSQLIDLLTSTTIGDVSTSLTDTLNNLGNVGSILLDTFIASAGGTPIDYGYLLSEQTLTQLFDNLNSSKLFTYLLPLVANIAINLDVVKDYIDVGDIHLDNQQWINEFQNIETVVIDLSNSGVLDMFFNSSNQPDESPDSQIQVEAMVNKMLSSQAYPYFTRIFNLVDESELLSKVIPSLLIYLGDSNPQIGDMLPKTLEELSTIQWGTELNIVYDNFYRLNKKAPQLVKGLLAQGSTGGEPSGPIAPEAAVAVEGEPSPEEPSVPSQPDTPTTPSEQDIMTLVLNNFDAVVSTFVGEFNDNGELINVDSNGMTIVYKNGKKIPNRHYTLMDSTLFNYLFPNLLEQLTANLGGEGSFLNPETIKKAIDELKSGTPIKNFKNELGSLLTAVKSIFDNPKLKDLIMGSSEGTTPDPTELLKDNEIVDSIVNLLPTFDKSKVFNIALKPFLVDTVKQQGDMFASIGLDVNDLNFETSDFTGEIAKLLKAMPNAMAIMETLSGGGDTSQLFESLSKQTDKIALLLDSVFDSDILNPKTTGNKNFFSILEYLFSDKLVEGMKFDINKLELNADGDSYSNGANYHKWTNSKNSNGEFLKDMYGNPIYDGETGYLANILTVLGKKASSGVFAGKTLLDVFADSTIPIDSVIGKLESDFRISNIFKAVDKSSIFSSMFGPFLDTTLKETGLIDENTNFSNIKDWTKEGKNFGRICNSIGELGVDLSNIDIQSFSKNEIPMLNVMLHSLSDSGIFTSNNVYNFNAFLFNNLVKGFESGAQNLLKDKVDKLNPGVPSYNVAMDDFDVYLKTVESSGVSKQIISSRLDEGKRDDWARIDFLDKYASYNKAQLNDLVFSSKTAFNDFFGIDELNPENTDYISKICYLLYLLQTKTVDGNLFGAISNQSISADDLGLILDTIVSIKPVRMILYNSFAQAKDISYGEPGTDINITLDHLNIDFFADDPFDATKLQKETQVFVDMYDVMVKALKNGSNMEDILADDLNFARLNKALKEINASRVFHTEGPAEGYTTTMYQEVLKTFLNSGPVKTFIYNAKSPKDIAYKQHYKNGDEKVDYLIKTLFNSQNIDDAELKKQQGNTTQLLEICSSLLGSYKQLDTVEISKDSSNNEFAHYHGDNTPIIRQTNDERFYHGLPSKIPGKNTMDFTYVDMNEVNGTLVSDILTQINESDLLCDMVPNVLKTVFTTIEGLPSEMASGFQQIDPYYIYRISVNGKTPSVENRFPRSGESRPDSDEFVVIAGIIDDFQETNTKLGSDFNALLNPSTFTLVKDDLSSMLGHMSESYLFHRAPLMGMDSDKLIGKRSLTAFESLLNGIFATTKISNIGNMTPTKMTENIRYMTAKDITPSLPNKGYSNTWFNEIDALMDLVGSVSNILSGKNLSELTLDITSPDFALNPDKISILLTRMNNVTLLDGTTSNLLSSAIKSAHLNDFTLDMNGNDMTNYNLSYLDLSDSTKGLNPFDDAHPVFSGEIKVFNNLLNKLYVNDKFIAIKTGGNPLASLIENGIKSEDILNFLHTSKMYSDVKTINNVDNVKVESLFMYNLLTKDGNELGKYIGGSTSNDKLALINHLMTTPGLYDPHNEGIALDLFMETASDLNAGTATGMAKIKALVPVIQRDIAALTHNVERIKGPGNVVSYNVLESKHGRSYLSSEILANMLDDMIQEEVNNIYIEYGLSESEKTEFNSHLRYFKSRQPMGMGGKVTHYNQINASTYDLLDPGEGQALGAIIDLYDKGVNTSGDIEPSQYITFIASTEQTDVDAYNNIFKKLMYVSESANTDGLAHNSYLGSVIFTSRINKTLSEAIKTVNDLAVSKELQDAIKAYDAAIKFNPSLADTLPKPPTIVGSGPVLNHLSLFSDTTTFVQYGTQLKQFANDNSELLHEAVNVNGDYTQLIPSIPPIPPFPPIG